MLLLLALVACTADDGKSPHGLAFALPIADLGPAKAASTGFSPDDGAGIAAALDASVPVFANPAPLWETPQEVFALLLEDTVRNQGVCPAETVDGPTLTYVGGCRSSFGYAFDGDVVVTGETVDGVVTTRLDADVEVVGDVDDPRFTRAALDGTVVRAIPTDGRVDVHYDVNMHVALEGYWEALSPGDAREGTWSDWTVSGTAEGLAGVWTVDLAVEIGGAGGMTVVSEALTERETCPVEVDGEATLGEGVTAVFSAASCDRCAEVTGPDGAVTACAP